MKNKKQDPTQARKERSMAQSAQALVAAVTPDQVSFRDFKNALLVVSVLVNVFVFTTWITLQVTDRYNAVMISFLLR